MDEDATCSHAGLMEFEPPLDPGIEAVVLALREAGVETFESCQGGPGHAYPEPTVRFHGSRGAGYAALAVALDHGFPVGHLRRVSPVIDAEIVGTWWEMTFDGVGVTMPTACTCGVDETNPSHTHRSDCPRRKEHRNG